ncbi:MAG: CocE/NonD family hydrolase [Leptolyngbyaceae cyanobacterium bins.59]|nr:CocE/NonD family hydrolase [Leptolyngbyaceae cyanobacterium bins.59]
MLKILPKKTLSMQTRDGVRLDADVYYPDAPGPFPVLLMRQPYGRAIASTVVYAHPSWYAANGYIVVIQDVRGRGTSEGEFNLFAHEIADGEDTVNWAATLPNSNGRVGMYGFSYQGMTQLYAAAARPEALKAIAPAMVAYDLYADWAYEGGAFCLQTNLLWGIQLAAEIARRQGNDETYHALYAAARNPPLYDPIPANPQILQELAPECFYYDWLANSNPDAEYWQRISPRNHLQKADLPMLHIGGWFDSMMRGTLHLYQAMTVRSHFPQFLVVGPWSHLPWSRKVGAIDYGPEAANLIDRMQIRWFDQFLKEQDTGLLEEAPVQLFEMGSNQWQAFLSWPESSAQPYFLSSTGLAAMGEAEGKLIETVPHQSDEDKFVHDPWRPFPSLGGHAAIPPGAFDRSTLEGRTDTVTYTSAPFTTDLHLAGEVWVEVYCEADSTSFDLCAVLSEVRPNGSVYNFTQGYCRVTPTEKSHPLLIPLQPTCICISKGYCLRLSLSAACFPAYAVNPGIDKPLGKAHLMDAQVITVTIHHGGNELSQVKLPIVT